MELCCKIISFFHKIIYSLSPVHLPSYFNTINIPIRQYHPRYMIIPYTAILAYQGNFSIKDWNILPI